MLLLLLIFARTYSSFPISIICSCVSKSDIIHFSRSNQHDNAHKTVEDIDPAKTAAGNNFYFSL